MAVKGERRTPRDWLRIAFRRRNLFLLSAAGFALVVLIAAAQVPPRYTASAILERNSSLAAMEGGKPADFTVIKSQLEQDLAGRSAIRRALLFGYREALPPPPAGVDPATTERGAFERMLASGKVLSFRMGEYELQGLTPQDEQRLEELVDEIRQDVRIRWNVSSDLIDQVTVTYTHSDPLLATAIPRILLHQYELMVAGAMERQADQLRVKHEQELATAELELANARNNRIRKQNENPIGIGMGTTALWMRWQAAEDEVARVQRSLEDEQETLLRLRTMAGGTLAAQPPGTAESQPSQVMMMRNPEHDRLRTQRLQVEAQLNTAVASGKLETHPDVRTFRARLAQIDEQLAQAPEMLETPVYDMQPSMLSLRIVEADDRIRRLERELEAAKEQASRAEVRMHDSENQRREYEQAQAEEELQLETVRRLRQQIADSRSRYEPTLAGGGTQIRRIQEPVAPYRPSYPTLFMIFAVAIVGGLGFGGALIFLVSSMDRSIATTEDAARHFDTQVYGVIGEIVSPEVRRRRQWRRWTVGPLVGSVVVAALALASLHNVLWLHNPEAFRRWQQDPTGFVYHETVQRAAQWYERLKA